MEFSFDRPKDAFSKKTAEPTPAPSANPRPATAVAAEPAAADPSAIQNERLRKAIERNRARQAQAAGGVASARPPQSPFQPQAQPQEEVHHQPSFLEKPLREPPPVMAAEPVREEPRQEIVEERPPVQERAKIAQHSSSSMGLRSTAVVSRKSVAKPEDTEFVPVKRATKKVASQISYSTSSTRKKAKPIDPTFTNYLVKGAWAFCVIMVLRLIFANGGVTDFYSQKSQLNERLTQLSEIKKDNMQLVREIERMRSDAGYQKRLVRDNLGFIAHDEFLILFPKGN